MVYEGLKVNLFSEFEEPEVPIVKHDQHLRSKPSRNSKFVSSVWSFPDAKSEQIYRWYGTLPKPLIERLLDLYCADGQTLVDPFVGSGTTLICASESGVPAIGADVNPLACLTTSARLQGSVETKSLEKALLRIQGMQPQGSILAQLQDDAYEYMRKWFRPDTLESMCGLLEAVAACPKEVQPLFFVVTAQIIRDVANVDPRCTHHLVTKLKDYQDPLVLFSKRVRDENNKLSEASVEEEAHVIQASALDRAWYPQGPKFVLAHPPYLGVIHYNQIHRLATDLLHATSECFPRTVLRQFDFDIQSIRASDVSTDNTATYRRFVDDFASSVRDCTVEGDRVAVIIGDQRNKGYIRHPVTDFIEAFESSTFGLEENFIWILQNNAGMHVLRRGHFIDHNYILVFKRT
jgi:DNA methylase